MLELLLLGVDLEHVLADPEDRPAARLVRERRDLAVEVGDAELVQQPLGRLGQRGQLEVEWEPMDEGVDLGLVVERARSGRAAVHEPRERDVLGLLRPAREKAPRRDHRAGVEPAPVEADVVAHDDVRARLVAEVVHAHVRGWRVRAERARQVRRHRVRVEKRGQLRERRVVRDRRPTRERRRLGLRREQLGGDGAHEPPRELRELGLGGARTLHDATLVDG